VSNDNKIRVLFLCTHNQARSQMAEGILRQRGGERFEVYSAGSYPAQHVHPMAIQALADIGINISQQQPKSLDQFLEQSFDYIITVCDRIRDSCPDFPGNPERIHWHMPDPVEYEGPIEQWPQMFNEIAIELSQRIQFLMQLPKPARLSSNS
jgi:protein-tyrosine-phosphatase